MTQITSTHNSTIKQIIKLRESSRERRLQKKFTIEGARELGRAIHSGFECETLFFCTEILSDAAKELIETHDRIKKVEVSSIVYERLVVRENCDGIFALMKGKYDDFGAFLVNPRGLYLVFDQIEKPGNFGALMRTADGVGVDAVIVLDPDADLFNPHAIRASIGAVFSRPIFTSTHSMFFDVCQRSGIKIVTASPHSHSLYFEENLSGCLAVVLGSEASGLSNFWSNSANHCPVKIPMNGLGDSLNVSVAGAVILYEALRQRKA